MEPPDDRIVSAAAWIVLKAPITFTSRTDRSVSSVMDRKGPPAPIPALATAISRAPLSFAANSTAFFTAITSVTSQQTILMLPEEEIDASSLSAASSSTSSLLPAMVTCAFASMSLAAIPKPIPVPPPVTRAVFDIKSAIFCLFLTVIDIANSA